MDGKLTDNNKESVKELLSTYRTLFAINVSGIFLVITLGARESATTFNPLLARIAIAMASISAVATIYLFFLSLRKIHQAEEDIIYQRPVVTCALASFVLLLGAFVTILFAIRS